jgi:hypothetical protein
VLARARAIRGEQEGLHAARQLRAGLVGLGIARCYLRDCSRIAPGGTILPGAPESLLQRDALIDSEQACTRCRHFWVREKRIKTARTRDDYRSVMAGHVDGSDGGRFSLLPCLAGWPVPLVDRRWSHMYPTASTSVWAASRGH